MKKSSTCGKEAENVLSRLFGLLAAHSYITAFLLCMTTVPLFFCSIDTSAGYSVYVLLIVYCLAAGLAVSVQCIKHGFDLKVSLPLTVAAVAVGLLGVTYFEDHKQRLTIVLGFGILISFALYAAIFNEKFKRQCNALLIFCLSFTVKLTYVLGTSVYERQHDVNWFGAPEETAPGHLGYVAYLFYNHKLYDADYREISQYCHPPLHHALGAVWIKLMNGVFGVDMNRAVESVQILPMFYSMTIIITAYKIFRHFRLDGAALYIPLIITAFHPCFTFLASLVNNDALAWALTMGAILLTLKWYMEPTLKNIIGIALCIGLGMMAKLSAALIAIPVAIVFLVVLIRSFKKLWKKLLGQFAAFGAVCAPLGLWFPVRGLIRWGIPLTYVQELPEMDQSIKGITFWERITDFSLVQVKNVYENWLWRDEYGEPQGFNEHNPLIAILKNSVFGEFINGNNFATRQYMNKVCAVFFWLAVFIAAVAFVCIITGTIRKGAADRVQKVFLVYTYAFLVGNLYVLSMNYRFVCSMNFRYLMPTVIIGALFLGFELSNAEKSGKAAAKALKICLAPASVVFAVLSSLIYYMVALGE